MSLWFSQWLQNTRLQELKERLDSQAEVIEETIHPSLEHGFVVRDDSELLEEMSYSRDFYFEFLNPSGKQIYASKGLSPIVQDDLRDAFKSHAQSYQFLSRIPSNSEQWLFQQEKVKQSVGGQSFNVSMRVAMNAQPLLEEMSRLRYAILFASMAALLILSLSSALMVSFSTHNLHRLAQQVKAIQAPYFRGQISIEPKSFEEALLTKSFGNMLKTVQASLETQQLFIAHASHELKTPIAAALSALEVILAKPRLAEDYEQTCRDVYSEVKVLSRLAHGLLDLARLEDASEMRVQSESTTVIEILTRLEERWKKSAVERDLQLIFIHSHNLKIFGHCDLWEIILGNLLDNAIKYSHAPGKVVVEGKWDGSHALFTITDHGCGMTEQEVNKLGEVFFRADLARVATGSFGLGFAYAKKSVETLGGSLQIESKSNLGTSITVRSKAIM